jgi:multidrug resistance efflux pump
MNANAFARAIPSRPSLVSAIEARVGGEIVQVRADMNGMVERVLVAKGQLVQKDDLLVELDHRELDERIAAAAAALDRALTKRNPGDVSSARVEVPASIEVYRARAAYMRARVNRLEAEVRAPVAGRVLRGSVLPGGHVGVSEALVSILEGNLMWVLARFIPSDFARLRLGQHATVRAGGHLVSARVDGIVAQVDPVLFEFIGRPDLALRPGMRAEVTVETG